MIFTKLNTQAKEVFTQRKSWIFLLCLLIVPFVVLAFFNHPCGDDFCYAQSVRTNPFWSMQSYWYNISNGRYSATFFITLNPLMAGSFFGYKMVMLFLLIAFVVSSLFVVKVFMGKKTIDVPVLAIAFFFLFAYILKMPSIVEGFYWLAAVMTYELPAIGLMLLLILLNDMKKRKNKIVSIALAALCCAVISGSNESVMLILLYVLVALSAFAWFTTKKIPAAYFILIAVTVIGILVVVFAPGNAVRASHFSGNRLLFSSIIPAVLSSIQHLIGWLPDVLLLTLLFLSFMKDVVAPGFMNQKVPLWLLVLYPFFIMGLLFLGFFPAQWGMNALPPPRSINATYFLFLLGYLYYVILLVTYVKQTHALPDIPSYTKYIVCFILFAHVYAKNNIRTAYMDLLSGRAVAYDRQMNQRYLKIESSRDGNVSFTPLVFPPSSIFLDDIEPDAGDWKNTCTSDYFQVKSLKINKTINE